MAPTTFPSGHTVHVNNGSGRHNAHSGVGSQYINDNSQNNQTIQISLNCFNFCFISNPGTADDGALSRITSPDPLIRPSRRHRLVDRNITPVISPSPRSRPSPGNASGPHAAHNRCRKPTFISSRTRLSNPYKKNPQGSTALYKFAQNVCSASNPRAADEGGDRSNRSLSHTTSTAPEVRCHPSVDRNIAPVRSTASQSRASPENASRQGGPYAHAEQSIYTLVKTWLPNPHKRDAHGRTALHIASRRGPIWVKHSLSNDALPVCPGFSLNLNLTDLINAQDNQGRTPAYYVTIRNDFCSLYLLAEKGANLDMADTDGRTALHIASKQGQLSMVDYLLEKSVWLEGRDKRGLTALHLAAMKGHTEAVRSLLRVAAQKGIRNFRNMQEDFYSRTPLHYAVLTVRLETIKALVEELGDGACVDRTGKKNASGHLDILDYQGRTALHVACAILAQLQTEPQDRGQSHHGISQVASAIVGVLMDSGASLDVRDYQGRTALHLACAIMSRVQMQTREHGNTDHDINHFASFTVSALVDAGAKLDVQDDMGCTPLMYAAQGAHLGAIRCLVDRDANVDAVDGRHWTARDYAENYAPQGEDRDEVLRILSPSRLTDPFLRLQ